MTLTRATLGKLTKRATKTLTICGEDVIIQRPTPLEYSHYRVQLTGDDNKPSVAKFSEAILMLTARMWIDEDGDRLFSDYEVNKLGSIDLTFYLALSEQCQMFAQQVEASSMLGESDSITGSDSPAESVLNSE
jgi:hypothetical protein